MEFRGLEAGTSNFMSLKFYITQKYLNKTNNNYFQGIVCVVAWLCVCHLRVESSTDKYWQSKQIHKVCGHQCSSDVQKSAYVSPQ